MKAERDDALPGLARMSGLVRTVTTPEFAGVTFYEVVSKSALNRVPAGAGLPFEWTINPYRGCSHACVYCFARSSHRYLDLDTGLGFDSQIIVKTNIVEVLTAELAKPSWSGQSVALGTNTDPYQRAEGRYQLMPGIIGALARSGTGVSILTKGSLLRRDLPLLAAAASDIEVRIAMSIAVFDEALQASIEPGTPSTQARLATISAARAAGLDAHVFLMPLMPGLTDGEDHLDKAAADLAAAGATGVTYGALHLRPGVKEWFAQWLRRSRPDLLPLYRGLYGTRAEPHSEYKALLAARVNAALERHGLDQGLPSWREGRKQMPQDAVSLGAAKSPVNALF